MNDKFRNKYRISSPRLPNYNYGSEGMYFITICVGDWQCCFGRITNKTMHLSGAGKIIRDEWLNTPEIRPDMNLTLDAFCVMPNHFHAILIIGKNKYNYHTKISENNSNANFRGTSAHRDADCRDAMHGVSTGNYINTGDKNNPVSSQINNNKFHNPILPYQYQNQPGPQRKNLSSIMRGFKSSCTKQIRQTIDPEFYWQERYYEHIIRNNKTYWKIRNYIINNPKNWKEDKFYKKQQSKYD